MTHSVNSIDMLLVPLWKDLQIFTVQLGENASQNNLPAWRCT